MRLNRRLNDIERRLGNVEDDLPPVAPDEIRVWLDQARLVMAVGAASKDDPRAVRALLAQLRPKLAVVLEGEIARAIREKNHYSVKPSAMIDLFKPCMPLTDDESRLLKEFGDAGLARWRSKPKTFSNWDESPFRGDTHES